MFGRDLFEETKDGCKAGSAEESLQLVPKVFGDGGEGKRVCPFINHMGQKRIVNRTGHEAKDTFV